MKKLAIILTLSCLTLTSQAHAQSWLDSLKSMFGMETEQAATPNVTDMIGSLSKNLNISTDQAKGGLASLLNYVKTTSSGDQFSQLSNALPGVDGILDAVPALSDESAGGLGGLLDKAAEYNESLKAINTVKKQFEALGLKPEMITGFISQAKSYLDTEQGQQAKELLTKQLSSLLG